MNFHIAYIGLGSNLSQPVDQIKIALIEIDNLPSTKLSQCSSLYKTKPVDCTNQPDFINAVVKVETKLSPDLLLKALNDIELSHHRVRGTARYGPRSLDLDILLYDDLIINTENLIIPHPHLTERRFVLLPLSEICPTLILPNKIHIQQALIDCQDNVSKPELFFPL